MISNTLAHLDMRSDVQNSELSLFLFIMQYNILIVYSELLTTR